MRSLAQELTVLADHTDHTDQADHTDLEDHTDHTDHTDVARNGFADQKQTGSSLVGDSAASVTD